MTFTIVGPTSGTLLTMLGIALVLGLVATTIWDKREDHPFSAWLGLAAVIVVNSGILFLFATMPFAKVVFHDQHLEVDVPIYGRDIAFESILVSEARLVDLEEHEGYRLLWRTNGLRVPNYSFGWFQLYRQGSALVVMRENAHVVFIPTKQGFGLLLQLEHPEEFLDKLNSVNGDA